MEDFQSEDLFTLPLLIGSSECDSGLRLVDGGNIIQKALLVYENTSLLNGENTQNHPLILCEVDDTNDESNMDTASQLSQDEPLDSRTETLSLSDGTTCSLSYTSTSLSDSLIIRSEPQICSVQNLRSQMHTKQRSISNVRSDRQMSTLIPEPQMNPEEIDQELLSVSNLINDRSSTNLLSDQTTSSVPISKPSTEKKSKPKLKALYSSGREPAVGSNTKSDTNLPSVSNSNQSSGCYQVDRVEPKEPEIDVNNLDTFIETVTLYNCRLCPHSSRNKNDITSHLKTFHLIKTSKEKEEMVVLKDNDPVECSDKRDSSSSVGADVKKCEDETQTVYMCGQCSVTFETMSECKAHMSSHPKTKKGNGIVHITLKPESEYILPDSPVISSGYNTSCEIGAANNVVTIANERVDNFNSSVVGRDCPDLSKKLDFTCSIANCGKEFSSKEFLLLHTDCHIADNVSSNQPTMDPLTNKTCYKCCKCHNMFKKWSEVALHLWKSHHIDLDLFKCSVCTFKTVQKLQLRRHFKNHSIGDFFCGHCGMSFIQKDNYYQHSLEVHKINLANIKQKRLIRIECGECGASLSSSKALKKHIRIVHGKLRPYICTICSFTSSTLDSLKLHLRQHTGETPFCCEYCSFKTRDHNTLRRHRMRHSFIKPYNCKHCPFSSVQATQLKNHILKLHPDSNEVFRCEDCTFTTLSESLITSHRKVHHREGRTNEADRDRSLSCMFPSSKKFKAELEIMDEDSSSQCYYDSADQQVTDTGGITIPATQQPVEAIVDMKSDAVPANGIITDHLILQ